MREYYKNPDALIHFIYLLCFTAGLQSMVTGLDSTVLLDRLPDFCIFKHLTGYKCPGCGMTHAFLSLGKFQIRDAFQYNILSPFLFYGGLLWLTPLRRIKMRLHMSIVWIISTLIFCYWVARNTFLIS